MNCNPELEPVKAASESRLRIGRAGSARPRRCEFRRILVPVDLSAGSDFALRHAAALAGACGGRVLPIHITPAICFTVDCGYGPVCRSVPDEVCRRRGRARLQRLVNRVVPAGLAEEVTVGSGEPVEQITRAATERKADLIVMMAHDAAGGDSTAPTHTVDRLLREIRCPLLVVHAGMASRKRRAFRRERTR